jgi:lysozyme
MLPETPTNGQLVDSAKHSMLRSVDRRLKSRRRRTRRRLMIIMLVALALGLAFSRASKPLIEQAAAAPAPSAPSALSYSGVRFIAGFEGFFPSAYDDPVGHCTIGYGTLIHLGGCSDSDRARWGVLSSSKALALLRKEAASGSLAVRSLVSVKLSQSQHDALVSFVYNCGVQAFASSTMLRLLNAGHYRKAADQLLVWDRAGGQVMAGLERRRKAERKLFLSR